MFWFQSKNKNYFDTKPVILFSIAIALFVGISSLPSKAFSAMESSSYKIDADSINVGGLDSAESTSYKSKDTAGEIGTGELQGILYKIKAGYRQMIDAIVSSGGSTPSSSSETVTTSSSSGGGGGPNNSEILAINNLKVGVSTDSAIISWSTTLQAKSKLVWGETLQYERGTLTSKELLTQHVFLLTGLDKNKKYYFSIESVGETAQRTGLTNQEFLTRETLLVETLTNISNLQAESGTGSIKFNWTNPTDAIFSEVIIVRSPDFYPRDVKDGQVIFEGRVNNFIDTEISDTQDYYYTIFAKDINGNYSSGVIIARLAGKVLTGGGETAGSPFENLPQALEVDELIKRLTLGDFVLVQDGKVLSIDAKKISVDGSKKFKISVPYDKFPEILKTIAVTVSEKSNPNRSFSFLLKADQKFSAYEATVGEFDQGGSYNLTITVIDYKNQGLEKLKSSLEVVKSPNQNIFERIGSVFYPLTTRVLASLLLTLVILFILIKKLL